MARNGSYVQEPLFEAPGPVAAPDIGIVYLMTDWYMLKWGWSGRSTPKPRSGELRASPIGFMVGSRADEAVYKRQFKRWCIGGEWFTVPASGDDLYLLWLIAANLGQWKGIPATEALARVIANNLRRAA